MAAWNVLIVGIMIMFSAFGALLSFHRWEEWTNIALAAWLIVSPWFLGIGAHALAFWNQFIVGIIVGVLALWSLTAEHDNSSGSM